jgi:hypothetical protein
MDGGGTGGGRGGMPLVCAESVGVGAFLEGEVEMGIRAGVDDVDEDGGGGGGGGTLFGTLREELGRRLPPGIGGGLPGILIDSLALFAVAVCRRSTILEAGRTLTPAEALRGIGGGMTDGRLGPVDEGGGGARPGGVGTGDLPDPIIVEGRFGGSTELVRGTLSDTVDVGRSATVRHVIYELTTRVYSTFRRP